jgi:hypothetical protein
MLQPTLVVGLGSSGLQAINELQRWMYSTFGQNSLPIFRFICIDTDATQAVDVTPAGSDIVFKRLTLNGYERAVSELQRNEDVSADWIPPNIGTEVRSQVLGAGGVRPVGRLCLWGDRNFSTVYQEFDKAWQDISAPNVGDSLPVDLRHDFQAQPIIYVVGTLGGGTGSGTFIDIGYILQSICGSPEQVESYAILFVPRAGSDKVMVYGNTWGALNELQYFVEGGTYYESWPYNVPTQRQTCPPFKSVYLISAEYGQETLGSMEFDRCVKLAGLTLFCNLLGMSGHRQARLADARNAGFGYYGTFGISAVMYPRYTLLETGGCRLAADLCRRWIQQDIYTADSDAIPIKQADIQESARKFIENRIEHAFSMLDHRQVGSLQDNLIDDLQRLLTRQMEDPRKFLQQRFTGDAAVNGYYSVVSENLTAVRDYLVIEISRQVSQTFDSTQNLHYAKAYIEGLKAVLQRLQEYWRKLGIPDSLTEWKGYADVQIAEVLSSSHPWLAQRPNALQDRLEEFLKKLKMFCTRKVLGEIADALERGRLTTVQQPIQELPTISHVETMLDAALSVQKACEDRIKDIAADIADPYMPIYRVWRTGTFDGDLNDLLSRFRQHSSDANFGQIRQGPHVDGLAAWQFLRTNTDVEVFQKTKAAYQRALEGDVQPLEVLDQAVTHKEQVGQIAGRALSSLLRLNRNPIQGGACPRLVMGNNAPGLQALVRDIHTEFQATHVIGFDHLRDAIVFYDEKGGFRPLEALHVREMLREKFESKPAGFDLPNEVWQRHRLAYAVDRQDRREKLIELMEFILDFGIIYQQQDDGRWKMQDWRWKERLPLTLDGVVRFNFKDSNGTARRFEIAPDKNRIVRQVAREQANCDRLRDAIAAALGTETKETLQKIYHEEIFPRLIAQGMDDAEAAAFADRYFGNPDAQVPKPGWFDTWLKGRRGAHA